MREIKNYFNGLRRYYGVGNKLLKSKLIALSKHEHNRRVGLPPLKTKGDMNKKKCCVEYANNNYEAKIKCGCGKDGTGAYWCNGTMCNYPECGPVAGSVQPRSDCPKCCQCQGGAGFHDC